MSSQTILNGKRAILDMKSALYPERLGAVAIPPKQLYVIGDPSVLAENALAIVGARRATPYGIDCATMFTDVAVSENSVVVTGGAVGTDTAVLETVVGLKGRAVVVLGTGCDNPYPSCNTELFQKVIDLGGAVVSEQLWDMRAIPHHFRSRNRIIAGLSRAVLVTECGCPSGTFALCDCALEAGRDVLAVPGPITSNLSKGTNELLAVGAKPVLGCGSLSAYLTSTVAA